MASSCLGMTLADGEAEPTVLRAAGLRHVAPYWTVVELPIGQRKRRRGGELRAAPSVAAGAGGDNDVPEAEMTIGDVLDVLVRDGNRAMRPTARWWREELSAGRVTLNGADAASPADAGRIVGRNDVLRGRFHYHEQSIRDAAPDVIYEDEHYVVVNKPPGLDVLSNPGGGRVRNSLPGLMAEAMRIGDGDGDAVPKPAHRLDASVSGLVCCGRTNSDAKRLSRRMELGESTKLYVARVLVPSDGMPTLPLTIDAPLGFDSGRCLAFVDRSSSGGRRGGKDATTTVTECHGLLDGERTAVVSVRITTGRKHQIRCHLQHAGMPIANDVRYGGCVGTATTATGAGDDGNGFPPSAFGVPHPDKELIEMIDKYFVKGCEYCSFAKEVVEGLRGRGPTVCCEIWLHSWKYEFPTLGLKFEAPAPSWAYIAPN